MGPCNVISSRHYIMMRTDKYFGHISEVRVLCKLDFPVVSVKQKILVYFLF